MLSLRHPHVIPFGHDRRMARIPTPLPAHLGDTFTPEQARAAGVSARRLRARDIQRLHRGLFVVRVPKEEEDSVAEERDDAPFARDRKARAELLHRARLYQRVMTDCAFFIGRSAAGLLGLPIACDGDLEVGVFAPHRAPRRRGIKGRQIRPGLAHIRDVEGLPVASPASTWAMLGAELTVRELIVVGDAIVRVPRDEWGGKMPEAALATIEQLRAALDAGQRKGAARLRAAIESIRVGSASPLETEYRIDAADAGLPEPELDVEIRTRRGRLLGITEIVYPDFRLLVEIEGDHHRTSRSQWNRDIEKYAAYVAAGYEVLRLTSTHIRGRRPRAASMVRAALIRRGWRP